MFINKMLYILIIPACICILPINAMSQTSDYDVKAVLLWRIAQFMEWPDQTKTIDESEFFVIAVIGKNPFGTILEDVYLDVGQKIKNKKVKIRYFTEIDQIGQCHLLFISGSEEKRLDDILTHTKGKRILIVGDTKNFAKKGVHVNFITSKDKIKFELNESSVAAEGFNVDYHLRSIARVVDR